MKLTPQLNMSNPTSPSTQVGFGFQPFVGNCTNGQAPPWCGYSLNDVKLLLTSIKNAGFTKIRTFGSGPWDGGPAGFQRGNAWNIQAASEVGGIKIWNCAALNKENDSISNQQIDAAIDQAKSFPNVVLGIIIGVEPIGLQGYTVNEVVKFINYAKQQRDAAGFTSTTLPITTSEQLGVLAGDAHKEVVMAVESIIFANYYPVLACGITIETAITDPDWGFAAKYTGLRNQIDGYGLSNLIIHIGETGWPSTGTIPTPPGCTAGVACANRENQAQYLQEIGNWATAESTAIQVYLFEAYNEMWKGNCDSNSIDSNWGMFDLPDGLNITKPFGPCQTPKNP